MADKPNFIMVPDETPPPERQGGMLANLRGRVNSAVAAARSAPAALLAALTDAEPPVEPGVPPRPRLVFAVDATASREPAWNTARQVTDALVKALPGALDVALAVHGGSRVHTFTAFTANPNTLRDHAAGITCRAGMTRLLPILAAALKQPGLRVVVYIGDVFEERLARGRTLADAMAAQGVRLIVLHDTADHAARPHAEYFWDLARRTGGCVLPFDAGAPGRLRDLLSAVAVYAVGGEKLLRDHRHDLPGAVALLEHLGKDGRAG